MEGIRRIAGAQVGREVARQIAGGWHISAQAPLRVADPRALVTAKEKQFVLDNGAAEGPTKLVAFELVPLRREEIPGVEYGVAHELKRISMKTVRAGLCNYIHYARRVLSIFRAEVVGLKTELLKRV